MTTFLKYEIRDTSVSKEKAIYFKYPSYFWLHLLFFETCFSCLLFRKKKRKKKKEKRKKKEGRCFYHAEDKKASPNIYNFYINITKTELLQTKTTKITTKT